MKGYATAALAVLLCGCAARGPVAVQDDPSRAGQVGVRDISGAVAPTARMALADNESFLMPLDDDANLAPTYPEALLARQLPPQPVCMRVSIDRQGKVLSSAPVVQAPHCPGQDAVDAAFFDAAGRAVAGWRFEPALRCVFPDAKTKEDTVGSCGGYTEVAEAVSLTYRFVFEQKDGRGTVRVSQ